MPEMNFEQAITQQVEEVIRDIEQRGENGQPSGAPVVDPAAENMLSAAQVIVAGMRQATSEAAQRFLEATGTMVREAMEKEEEAKVFTDRLIAHTEEKAAEITDFFQRRRNACLALSEIVKLLNLPPDEEKAPQS